jgi:tetratricopeptide (TPR) repeat protein
LLVADLFGEQHHAILDWLIKDWWQKGPPVAVIQGFPGIGKTEIALHAVTEFRKTRPRAPAVLFDCPETRTSLADDLLLSIAEELASVGDTDLVERLERGEQADSIFARVLGAPRFVVLDEAQRLLIGSTSDVPEAVAATLERFSRTVGAQGRLLLLSNRDFGNARWTERVESITLLAPKPKEAELFLRAELQRRNLNESVPTQRYRDVVTWLGCNPRALRLLASALVRENLDELIGLAPQAWEVRDRSVSTQLLHEFERVVLARAEERLDQPTQVFLRRLSVLRRPFDRQMMEALSLDVSDMVRQRDDLIARFMMEFRNYFYELHSILRDTVRRRMSRGELRRAHLAAGRFYAAPFRARRTLGEAERLGARFIEARYHFTLAESENDLAEISARFENHLRAQFHPTSPVPSDPQERDERITLLSALLQARGAKGLEYYLARCLVARNQPGDVDRALPHARRATGPQAPADAWVLRIKVEHEIFGSSVAAQVAREGIKAVPPTQNLFSLYQAAAEILAREGKRSEALELLREGIKVVPPTQSLSSLYQAAAEILARERKLDEAVELLREGIKVVPPTQNLFSLYQAAAEILAREGKSGEALELLYGGIKTVPPALNLFSLYQAAAEILAREGKSDEAVKLLREGIKIVPPAHSLFSLYLAAAGILSREGKLDEAVELLHEGIKAVLPAQSLFLLYVAAAEILARKGQPGEAMELLRQGLAKVTPQNGYRLTEAAILIGYRENQLDQLRSDQYAESGRDLLGIMTALAANDAAKAANLGVIAIDRNPFYFALYAQASFAYLCAGKPERAESVLRRFPRPIEEESNSSTTWLLAFVAVKMGNLNEARAHLERYLARPLRPDESCSEVQLIRLWDDSAKFWGASAAVHFSRLPPSLTGLRETIVSERDGGSALTDNILRELSEAWSKSEKIVSSSAPEEPISALSKPPSSFDSDRIVRAMRPDRWYGLYVLGCYDQTKTVYVQQCRALTLVHALFEIGELKKGRRLGIVGGGAAGVTAAAAAAIKGADVLLFERAENLLPLQRQNTKRYLHPHLYDWPAGGSTDSRAQLPVLGWDANQSNEVAAQIFRGYEEISKRTKKIALKLGTSVQDIVAVPSSGEEKRIQILAMEGAINELVDVAIVAVGFGVEPRRHFGVETPHYWEDDGLDQTLASGPDYPHRILVSGSGDGALIDVLRATLRDFRHEEMLSLLPDNSELLELQNQLQRIEIAIKRAETISNSNFISLHQMYGDLPLSETFIAPIRTRIRRDTEVWYNFTSPGRYSTRSSILNRFLVSVLCRLNAVRPKLGRLDEKFLGLDASGRYSVRWSLNEEPQLFDRIIVRHGPPVDYLGSVFPSLGEASAPLRGKLRELNLTNALDQKTYDFFSTIVT